MALPFYNWSQTKSDNATADSGVNWAEGQAPSSVNDSARAMMASTAAFRDDIAGAIVTGGSGSAYTVASYQTFDSLAHLNGRMIAFVPHASNTSESMTLNVDSLGAKPLRLATSVDLKIGMLIAGTPYTVTYNNSDGVFYIHGWIPNPQSAVPVGACLPYFGTSAPNTYFAIPLGQAISRTTYPGAFSIMGTTFGVGDGSTTFNLPDMGGRSFFGKEATATRLTAAGGGLDGGTLGAVGGAQNVTLASGQIPSLTSVNASQAISVGTTGNVPITNGAISAFPGPTSGSESAPRTGSGTWVGTTLSGSNSISVAYTNASQAVTKTVSPGIVGNWIMRVL